MRQAASLKNFSSGTVLPGITINSSPEDFAPIQKVQIMSFKGERWDCSARS
jgi:branched-chain amino acid transport system substrate-binding protein